MKLFRRMSSKISIDMFGKTLLFFVFVALPVAQGLYFHIAETERKCFIEEIPDETMVIGELVNALLKGMFLEFKCF